MHPSKFHPTATGTAGETVARHASEEPVKLHGAWFCPYVQRSWITLEEKKIPYQYIEINPYDKTPAFLKLSPRGLVPALSVPTPAGEPQRVLIESAVINEYLDETFSDESRYGPSLLPSDPYERARARLWMDHISTRVIPAYHKILGASEEDLPELRAVYHRHVKDLVQAMDAEGPWFLGNKFSSVDIALAPWAKRLFLMDHLKPANFAEKEGGGDEAWNHRWAAWIRAIDDHPSVQATWSDEKEYTRIYENRYLHGPNGTNGPK